MSPPPRKRGSPLLGKSWADYLNQLAAFLSLHQAGRLHFAAILADMVELVDTLGLGPRGYKPCGFKSCCPYRDPIVVE